MRVFISGGQGQLGWELCRQASGFQIEAVARDLPRIDITRPESVARNLEEARPEVVINAAAYTQVDRAESDAEAAMAVNRDGPGHLAEACSQADIPLIHISTDFVFNGQSRRPYRESDPMEPLGLYGRSKAAGETAVQEGAEKHLILRTAWLYGVHGHNFVKTMLRLAAEREELQVVADQQGSPTAAADLARAIWQICDSIREKGQAPWGTYHYCGAGVTTWYGLVREAIRLATPYGPLKIRKVNPITTAQYPTPARRPAYSALDCSKIGQAFNIIPPPWQVSLEAIIAEIFTRRSAAR